jgi:hypothetical protein
MFGFTKETRAEKARRTTRDAVSYVQEIIRDERLRGDMRAAVDHGAQASDRVKKAVEADGITTRLAADKKLRKNLRAMLDDLDDAGGRIRRKKTHRVRNVFLMLAGAVAALLAFPKIRPWLNERASDVLGTGSTEPEPMT